MRMEWKARTASCQKNVWVADLPCRLSRSLMCCDMTSVTLRPHGAAQESQPLKPPAEGQKPDEGTPAAGQSVGTTQAAFQLQCQRPSSIIMGGCIQWVESTKAWPLMKAFRSKAFGSGSLVLLADALMTHAAWTLSPWGRPRRAGGGGAIARRARSWSNLGAEGQHPASSYPKQLEKWG